MKKPEWWNEGGGYYNAQYLKSAILQNSIETVALLAIFWERELHLRTGAQVLDVGCGIGHVGIELARRGYAVTGVDINRLFLQRARRGAKKAGVAVRFVKADMRTLPFGAEFDAAFAVGPVIGNFAKESDDTRVFKEMARVLQEGGRVLVDQWKGRQSKKKRSWEEAQPDGSVKKITAWEEGGRAYVVMKHHSTQVRINYRIYTAPKLSRCFTSAGLSVVGTHFLDYWEFLPVSRKEAYRVIVVARKN